MNIKAIYIMQKEEEIESLFLSKEEDIKKEFSLKIAENEQVLDLDIYWDALHYVLVGSSLLMPDFLNPLSEMLSGTFPFYEESEDYISYIMPKDMKNIVEELNKINIYEKTLHLSIKTLADNEIYPESYSEYKEEHDRVLREEIRDKFNELKVYFNNALNENNGIILAIM